ncbi:MAG: L-threonylcarbamoyladenylate synthase [Acidilobaceae archaeon]
MSDKDEVMIDTKIFKVDPFDPDINVIRQAAYVIKRGGLVAFPTETVYGLGCNAFDANAARKVFEAKMRPPDNPLIVHIHDLEQLKLVAKDVPEEVYKLARRFWPGPLTLVLEKTPQVPSIVTGGLKTVAVRLPAHPVALKLIEEAETPIAAPSANISGRPSPTCGEHVIKDLKGRIDVIIDAGETLYGVESTILDVLHDPPRVLRLGAYPIEEIEKELNKKVVVPDFAKGLKEAETALAPGMKYRHYSPQTPLVLIEAQSYERLEIYVDKILDFCFQLIKEGRRVAVLSSKETSKTYIEKGIPVVELGSRNNPYELAKNLYRALRSLDELRVDVVVAEGYEETGLKLTVMSRLRKASSQRIVVSF